jgi:hypothetical protein
MTRLLLCLILPDPLHQPAHIPNCEQTPKKVIPAGVFFIDGKGGGVVWANNAVEPNFFVGANTGGHTGFAVVVEGFGEGGYFAVQIPKVCKSDFAFAAKMVNVFNNEGLDQSVICTTDVHV